MSLISAIPKIWKEKLKAHSEPMQDQKLIKIEIPHIKIGQKFVVIQKINKQSTNFRETQLDLPPHQKLAYIYSLFQKLKTGIKYTLEYLK